MTTGTAAPHSRWALQAMVSGLAASHADATAAIRALTAAEALRDRPRNWPPLSHLLYRIRGWGWFQAIRLSLAITLTALFMAWISVRLVTHLAALPALVAAIPGVLLTMALVATASYAARSLRQPAAALADLLRAWGPLAIAAASLTAWIALWLARAGGIPAWPAATFALALTVALAVVMVTCAYPGMPAAAVTALPAGGDSYGRRKQSVRSRIRHKRARKRLDHHRRNWVESAHRYAMAIVGTGQPERALARLIDGYGESFPLEDIDPYDVIILSALRSCHPAPLAASLDAVAERL
jgi:hypothetical protein